MTGRERAWHVVAVAQHWLNSGADEFSALPLGPVIHVDPREAKASVLETLQVAGTQCVTTATSEEKC